MDGDGAGAAWKVRDEVAATGERRGRKTRLLQNDLPKSKVTQPTHHDKTTDKRVTL